MAKEKTTSQKTKPTVTRNEAIGLYNMIAKLKSSHVDDTGKVLASLSRDAMIRYIPLRVKLKDTVSEFEEIRKEAQEQTKPKGYDDMPEDKQSEAMKEWGEAINPILEEWLGEPFVVNMKIFSFGDATDLVQSNPGMTGDVQDFIFQYFVKDEE